MSSFREITVSHDNEQLIRHLYQVAEDQDGQAFADCFAPDGVFTNTAFGLTARGHDELSRSLDPITGPFPDMHREITAVHVATDTVIVECTLVATHNGPLPTPAGVLAPTGIKTETPCCDVFYISDGKVDVFNCYPEVIVTFAQLGILNNLEAAVAR
ncbi:nuclear transport factor 2 family protein [Actinoplanes sp. TBRC 11911]|uniref:nuclear transport factor 2 family protein n=1 Tax=Actinoplanes sp. TBRC 11911 TaxID=2729386 RepID=UPI00145D4223|nr:nuclear transport factor 2 family protein [Actinoplanes sp. TBRC 11911]NMO57692.1 nuclear transport factor 2 family protein [Actinoplanes sp. TBRC 11911]